MNKKQEIILRYYRQKQSERQISRELQINRSTVRRYLKEYEEDIGGCTEEGEKRSEQQIKRSLLEAPRYDSQGRKRRKLNEEMVEQINKYLEKNKEKRAEGNRKQTLKKIDIWEEIGKQGYKISYGTVCNYIRSQGEHQETYIRQKYEAGEVCEFDWGEVKLEIGGIKRVYQMAVFTLAWSNYRYGMLFAGQETQSFQQSHIAFFEHIQGVPGLMVYDNMRVAVKRFVGPSEKEATEGLLSMSMYYQFGFRFCNVGKGNEKGHVERSVEYVRRKAFGLKDEFEEASLANQYLQEVLVELNNKTKKAGEQTAGILLQQEQERMGKCPVVKMECGEWSTHRVDKYATIYVKSNHYSVPEEYTGKMVEIKLYADYFQIYYNGLWVGQHERRHTLGKWYVQLDHYLETFRRKPGALKGSEALDQAQAGIKSMYEDYFKPAPRQFIELLQYRREHALTWQQIQQAITELLQLGCRDICLDKIKVRLEHSPKPQVVVPNGQIEKLAQEQLQQVANLFNLL